MNRLGGNRIGMNKAEAQESPKEKSSSPLTTFPEHLLLSALALVVALDLSSAFLSLPSNMALAQGPYQPYYPNQALPAPGDVNARSYIEPVRTVGPGQPGFAFPQGMPPGGQQTPGLMALDANHPQTSPQAIQEWFQRYDQVRRQAQMTPQERQKADTHLSKGLSIFIPGDEKVAVQKLLNSLVSRYNIASEAMKQLPLYPETKRLHLGYYQYFTSARLLFGDYLRVQQNPLVQDTAGNAVAPTLLPRKQELEMLDQANKALDAQLRNQFGIAPYKY